VGSGVEPRPKTNLVNSKAVRKPLVAIVLNIMSTILYSTTTKNLALANMTVSDGIDSVVLSGGGGRSRLCPLWICHCKRCFVYGRL